MVRALIYGTVVALAALGLSSSIVVLGFLLLILPGFLLLLAPTAALYLPFADLMFTGARRRRGDLAALGLVGVMLVAIGLPLAGELTLRRQANEVRSGAIPSPEAPPESIMLVRFEPSLDGPRRPWGRKVFWVDYAKCEEVCAQLLLSGRVREVIRPLWSGYDPAFPLKWRADKRAFAYSLAPTSACRAAERYRLRIPQALLAEIGASGRCISIQEAKVPEAETVLTMTVNTDWEDQALRPVSLAGPLVVWRSWRCAPTGCDEFASAVSGVAAPLSMPLHLSTDIGGIPPVGRRWSRRTVPVDTTNAFPWPAVGLSSAPQLSAKFEDRVALDAPISRSAGRAAAAKALAASVEHGRALQPAERAAIKAALTEMADRRGELDPEDLDILQAVARHPTLDDPLGIDVVFRKHPDAAAKLEAVLVESYLGLARAQSKRMAELDTSMQRAAAGDYREYFRRAIGRGIEVLPPDRLAAHRGELATALADPAMDRDAQMFPDFRGR